MKLVTFAAGWSAAMVVLASLATVAVVVRRRLLPAWDGAWARLAECVVAAATLVVIAQAIGLAGLLRPWVLAATTAAAAATALVVDRARATDRRGPGPTLPDARREPVGWRAAAGLVATTIATVWLTTIELILRKGMYDFDTLVYHGPFAARFAQAASTAGLHQIATGQAIAYHPASAELVHGVGIALLGSDVLSPFLNGAWLVVALLAAWCAGSTRNAAAASLAVVAAVGGAPGVVTSQAGTGGNDLAGTACFLAAVAFVMRADRDRPARLLATLAAGLAIGMKLSLVVPVAALVVAVVAMARRGTRRIAAAAWLVAAAIPGGYWYVRNLAIVGNPVPALRVGIGGVTLPQPDMPILDRFSDTVLLHASPQRLTEVFLPGLRGFFGPCWWLLVAGAAVGIVSAIAERNGDRMRRALGVVAVVAAVGYALTPTSGEPVVFEANLRYVLPSVALGLLLLAGAPWAKRVQAKATIFAGAALVVATAFLDVEPWSLPSWDIGSGIAVATIAFALVVAALHAHERGGRAGLVAVGAVVFALAPVAVVGVQSRFLDRRYADAEGDLGLAFRWARDPDGERVGVSGAIEHYPLFGPTFANSVRYLGDERPDTSYHDLTTCAAWREAVADGHYSVLVVSRSPIDAARHGPPPEAAWAESSPALYLIESEGHTTIWGVDGAVDGSTC